eukprot:scaffold49043_cov69-Phaeocystis_antarctica.AAC.7
MTAAAVHRRERQVRLEETQIALRGVLLQVLPALVGKLRPWHHLRDLHEVHAVSAVAQLLANLLQPRGARLGEGGDHHIAWARHPRGRHLTPARAREWMVLGLTRWAEDRMNAARG